MLGRNMQMYYATEVHILRVYLPLQYGFKILLQSDIMGTDKFYGIIGW